MIEVARLQPAQRPEWDVLFDGYNRFYGRLLRDPKMHDRAWAAFLQDPQERTPVWSRTSRI